MPARSIVPPIALGAVLVSIAVMAAPAQVSADRSRAASDCSASGLASWKVGSGDTWFGIAQGAEVPMPALLEANEASIDTTLHPGDVVCLPSGAVTASSCTPSNAPTYTVVGGDSWSAIAAAAGVTLAVLLDVNAASADRVLHPGNAVCLPEGASLPAGRAAAGGASGGAGASSAGGPSYTVMAGDSWSAIALAAEVGLGALLSANEASADTVLHPGDAVRLPAGAKVPDRARAAAVQLDALPVQGPCGYVDTWRAPRGGGRRHAGVDVFARRGEYVYAVTDGRLSGRGWDQPGRRSGNSWWLTSADGRTVYFYAHLADFAPGLQVGSRVRAGQIIGWVGSTGNASGAHLHFEIRPGGGEAVNPYPILAAAGGCNWGTPYVQPGGWTPERRG